MAHSPPTALLRLRESDIVRLCGLVAAGQGLDLAAHLAVGDCRRNGPRLEGSVHDGGSCATWASLPTQPVLAEMRWGCARDAPAGAPTGAFGCLHVAALLSAWISTPEDFVTHRTEEHGDVYAGGSAYRASTGDRVAEVTMPGSSGAPEHQSQSGHSLADELRRLPADRLLAIARRVLDSVPSDEPEVRARVAAILSDTVLLEALVARLDPAAAALLTDMLLVGGTLTSGELDALAARSERPARAMRAQALRLERHGLIFRATAGDWRGVAGWRVPYEIRAAFELRLPLSSRPIRHPEAPPNLPARTGDANRTDTPVARRRPLRPQRANPRHMVQTLALLTYAPAPLGQFATPSRLGATVRRTDPPNTVSGVVGDLQPSRLVELAAVVGLPVGLLRVARRTLLWARDDSRRHALLDLTAVAPDERATVLREGFRLWLAAESPAELADLDLATSGVRARFDPMHPAFRPAALAAEAAEARAFIVHLMTVASPGAWFAVDDLVELIWRINPFFLRGHQRQYGTPCWWLETATRRLLRTSVREDWLEAEGAYIRRLLVGPLQWWGVIDLALDATELPVLFRVSLFGAFLLGQAEWNRAGDLPLAGGIAPAALPTRDGALAVEPLLAGASLLAVLGRWARPTAVAGRRLIYALAPDLAATAFDQGETSDDLMARLRAEAGPGGMRAATVWGALVDEWRARHGRAHLSSGMTLLEATDEAALTEALAAVPHNAGRCRRLGSTAALIAPTDAELMRTALKARGYEV